MAVLTRQERDTLNQVSANLGVNPPDLEKLIQFESRWNPSIKNPNPKSSARGLVQIINDRARQIGFSSSLDAVQKNPTISLQLKNVVYPYLKLFTPIQNRNVLAMAVFLPAYRYKDINTPIPAKYRKGNPGIDRISDYLKKVYGQSLQVDSQELYSNTLPKLLFLGVLIFLSYKTIKKGGLFVKSKTEKAKENSH
jgi:hypothetical protein